MRCSTGQTYTFRPSARHQPILRFSQNGLGSFENEFGVNGARECIVVVKYFFRVDSFRPGFASEGGGSLVDVWIHEWCCERVTLAGD